MEVLTRVLPFFALIAIGLVLARLKRLDQAMASGLSAYVFWVGFPALLVYSLSHAPPLSSALAGTLGLYGLAAAAPLILAALIGKALGWTGAQSGGVGMAGAVGNTAFLGGPLAISVFGAAAAPYAAQIVAVDCAVILALAVTNLRAGAHRAPVFRAVRQALSNPIVAAAVTGVALSMLHITLPASLDRLLSLAAATGSPVALVALGAVIGLEGATPRASEAVPVGLSLVLKLFVVPTLVWLVLHRTGAPDLFVAVAVLMAACPTAVNVFIQTRNIGAFAREGAQAVTWSTALSVLTLTVLAAVLSARLG